MMHFLQSMCIDGHWLLRNATTSLGCLLFKNGFIDLNNRTFFKNFNPDIVCMAHLSVNYKPLNAAVINYMHDVKWRFVDIHLGLEILVITFSYNHLMILLGTSWRKLCLVLVLLTVVRVLLLKHVSHLLVTMQAILMLKLLFFKISRCMKLQTTLENIKWEFETLGELPSVCETGIKLMIKRKSLLNCKCGKVIVI